MEYLASVRKQCRVAQFGVREGGTVKRLAQTSLPSFQTFTEAKSAERVSGTSDSLQSEVRLQAEVGARPKARLRA